MAELSAPFLDDYLLEPVLKFKFLSLIAMTFAAGAAVAGPFDNNGDLYSISVEAPKSNLTRAQVRAELEASRAAGQPVGGIEVVAADSGFVGTKTRAQVQAELAADAQARKGEDPTKNIYFGS